MEDRGELRQLIDASSFFFFLFWFFKIRFLCVALALLIPVDQVGLELTEILLPLPPKCWD